MYVLIGPTIWNIGEAVTEAGGPGDLSSRLNLTRGISNVGYMGGVRRSIYSHGEFAERMRWWWHRYYLVVWSIYVYVERSLWWWQWHHQRVGPSSAFVLISSSFDPFYGFLSPSPLCTLAYEGMYNNFCMVVIRRSLIIGHVSLLVSLIAWIN